MKMAIILELPSNNSWLEALLIEHGHKVGDIIVVNAQHPNKKAYHITFLTKSKENAIIDRTKVRHLNRKEKKLARMLFL